jgi:hypothetical protein
MSEHKMMFIGAAVAALALLILVKKKGAAAAVGADIGAAAVDLAGGVVAGASMGIGDALGIPRTNMNECERAIAEGRTWDASFACPASDFLSSLNPFK